MRPSDTLYFQQIAFELEKVGVKLELLQRTVMRQSQDMFAGKIDTDFLTMFSRGSDPIADYRLRTCAGLTPGRAGFHCDPDVTAATKAALAELDLTKRAALYRRLAQLEQASPPGIILWQGLEFDALGKDVSGYAPYPDYLNLHLVDITR